MITENIDETLDNMGVDELLEELCERHKMYHFESESGLCNLEKVFLALDPNYDSIEEFLADNPGAQRALIEWISSISGVPQWEANLKEAIKEHEEIRLEDEENERQEAADAAKNQADKEYGMRESSPDNFDFDD